MLPGVQVIPCYNFSRFKISCTLSAGPTLCRLFREAVEIIRREAIKGKDAPSFLSTRPSFVVTAVFDIRITKAGERRNILFRDPVTQAIRSQEGRLVGAADGDADSSRGSDVVVPIIGSSANGSVRNRGMRDSKTYHSSLKSSRLKGFTPPMPPSMIFSFPARVQVLTAPRTRSSTVTLPVQSPGQ